MVVTSATSVVTVRRLRDDRGGADAVHDAAREGHHGSVGAGHFADVLEHRVQAVEAGAL